MFVLYHHCLRSIADLADGHIAYEIVYKKKSPVRFVPEANLNTHSCRTRT